jgi:predicted AAA+ superfamily ATPase
MTGSSARKLKRGGANLLAGRAFVYHLFPFSFLELEESSEVSVLALGFIIIVFGKLKSVEIKTLTA